MARLGYIIQVLFEMTASHLMALEMSFDSDDLIYRFEIPAMELDSFDNPHRNVNVLDATSMKLGRTGLKPGQELDFFYDYGDNWSIKLMLEETFVDLELPTRELPRVLDGAGFGIVEDVGGTGGLTNLMIAYQEKKGDDYEMYRAWLGTDTFDINEFDQDDLNFRLKRIPRIYKQSYEDRLVPKQHSIDLIERKYKKNK